jgi:hypothetical protein
MLAGEKRGIGGRWLAHPVLFEALNGAATVMTFSGCFSAGRMKDSTAKPAREKVKTAAPK